MKTSAGKLDNINKVYCSVCNKYYDNEVIMRSHIKNGSHRNNKELNDLKNYIKLLEERNRELEKMVDESSDALFVYEMKVNNTLLFTPK